MTTKTALAQFDAAQRRLATRRGRPTPALLAPSVVLGNAAARDGSSATFFWAHDGKLVCARPGERRDVATPGRIAHAILDPGSLAVAVDDAAAARMTRMMGGLPAWSPSDTDDMKLARQGAVMLRFCLSQPVSSRATVLTRALARRYYLPDGTDTTSLASWRKAFRADNGVGGLAALLGRCTELMLDPRRFLGGAANSPEAKIARIDGNAAKQSAYANPSGMASLLSASEGIAEVWSGMLRTDPVARQRHVLDGSVVRLSNLRRVEGGIEADLSSPSKLKDGETVVLCDDDPRSDRIAYARLESLSIADDETITALFCAVKSIGHSRSNQQAGTFAMLDGACAAGDSVLATAEPFFGGGNPVWAGRWGEKIDPGEKPIRREVPLDVLLAAG